MLFNRKKKQDIDACIDEAGPDVAYHAMDTGEVIEIIETDPMKGLTDEEITCRVEQYGPNMLVEKGRTHPILLFLGQFIDRELVLIVGTPI